jgi:exopolysaccharide production protein ExoZ
VRRRYGATLTIRACAYSSIPSLSRVCVPALLLFAGTALISTSDGFANTIVAEFIFGIIIGNAIPRLQTLRPAVGLIAFALLLIVPVGSGLARPLTWGFLAAGVVAAVVSIEMSIRRHLPGWLLAAGNASYATYLTHGFVIPAVFILCKRLIGLGWVGLGPMVILGLFCSAILGQIIHVLVEKPLLLHLRTRRPVSAMPASVKEERASATQQERTIGTEG